MNIEFNNKCVMDGVTLYAPFPNCISFKMKNLTIAIGLLTMSGNTWEEQIMYRKEQKALTWTYTHFRFLIFAIAKTERKKNGKQKG